MTGQLLSPRRTQLEPGFIERGTLCLKMLRRAAVIEIIPRNGSSDLEPKAAAAPKELRDPLKLSLLPVAARLWQVREPGGRRPLCRRQPGKGDAGVAETSVKTKKRSIEYPIADRIQHLAFLAWLLDRFVRMALVIT
jgi:hypothetical protein